MSPHFNKLPRPLRDLLTGIFIVTASLTAIAIGGAIFYLSGEAFGPVGPVLFYVIPFSYVVGAMWRLY
jgi:hypothetical protein